MMRKEEDGRAVPAALVVVLLTVPALVLFTRAGYWQSDDGLIHLYRLMSLHDATRWGQWYPRIFPEFAFAYGYAVLNYYAPLTYYVGLLLIGLGAGPVLATKLTFALSLPLSSLAMWWLARDVWARDSTPEDAAGLVAAGVYTYVPYHLADVFQRGALAESWAFVWWPLMLWAIWRRRFVLLAVTAAGLVLTHNLSAVLIAPVLLLWLLATPWIRDPDERVRGLAQTVGAGVLGALVSAFYWLPVLLESRWVHLVVDVGGRGFVRHLHPWREWLASGPLYAYFPQQGVAGEHPLAWAQLAIVIGAVGVGVYCWRRLPARRAFVAAVVVVLGSLFLLTTASLPLWDLLVFPLGMIQYPWRWLGIIALAAGLLSGVFVLYLPDWRVRWGTALGITLLLGATTLPGITWEPLEVDTGAFPNEMWQWDFENEQIGATWTAEYVPRWVREERWAIPRPVQRPAAGETLAHATVELDRATPWSYTLRVDSEAPLPQRLHRFYLPAWQVRVDGEPVVTSPHGSLGLVSATIPAGTHRVDIVWARTPAVTAGILLSGIGIALLIALGALRVYRRRDAMSRTVQFGGTALAVLVILGYGRLALAPSPPPPTSVATGVGERATLLAWRPDDMGLRAGDTTRVTLYWLSRGTMGTNYNVFVHLTGADGVPVAQSDGYPGGGYTPTTRWLSGEVLPDPHRLDVPADLGAGEYQLWAGVYDPATGERLPVADRDDGRIFLGTVRIE